MTVNVYGLRDRLLWRRGTLAEVKSDVLGKPGYFATYDTATGERCERKGGEWRQTQAPDAEIDTGTYRDGKMAAAGDRGE